MNSAKILRHVRRLSEIASRRAVPGAVYCAEIAGSRSSPLSYLRRAASILRASKGAR